jgi:hypothetical protein
MVVEQDIINEIIKRGLHSKGRLIVLPTNIRLECNTVANTPAYDYSLKKFFLYKGKSYETFTAVSYEFS